MRLPHPTIYPDLLRENLIPFNILLVLTAPPRPMPSFDFTPFTPTHTAGDNRRRRDGRRKSLRVQAIHDQLLHAFLGIVELAVGNVAPNVTQGHLVGDKSQKVADDLDLLVDHPLAFSEFHEEGSQKFGDGVGGPVS